MNTALVLMTVMVGAAAQRITGMGFALVSAPFLVLLVGGFEGVLMVNLCATFTSAVILTRVWRDIPMTTLASARRGSGAGRRAHEPDDSEGCDGLGESLVNYAR